MVINKKLFASFFGGGFWFLSFSVLDDFSVFLKKWVLGILGPPYCGIGATIRIGREMLCLPYAGFFNLTI